ncbi:N-acyl homoserine lactonase family protein [uncultured Dysosmobacter sp.]|uniref:N-acyl homoserine lactonase family protein n=1 Tax=uncultured Dysosmobacter sp. TaxID=2591384 RepID=UPI002602F3D4|nr:N-acyl homoserine lactonase family protein [uncultured Dysosmobacter sp.]
MKAYVLNTGTLKIDKNAFLLNAVQARRDNPNPRLEYIDCCTYAVLVDHPTAGKFLYDLGVNPDALSDKWPEELKQVCPYTMGEGEDFLSQLALCDTKPEDVKTIILSHLHWDHTGNMHLFEHCDVYAPIRELESALLKIHSSSNLDDQFPYYKPDLEVPVKHLIGLTDEEEEIEIFPGVHLINLPGHTPGLFAMLLELEGGNIVFPSDASYLAANYGPPAHCTGGVLYDNRAYMRSMEVLRKYAKRYNARVLFSHDIEFFKNEMKVAPEYYA